jgi:ankyrin repeat protein
MLSSMTLVALLALAPAPAEKRSVGDQLAIAIERADLPALKALIEAGNPADTPIQYGPKGITPLMKAAWEGRADVAKYLIAQGANVNALSTDGEDTPLAQAATRGYDDVVEILLKAGANAKAKNKNGYAALGAALFNGHLDVADQLLAAGADVNGADNYGITPLMTASSICNPDLLRYLAEKGAVVDKISQLEYGGSTALTTAAGTGQVECVKALLELGADPRLKMKDGGTALSHAQESKNNECVALIQAALAKAPPKPVAKPAAKKTP